MRVVLVRNARGQKRGYLKCASAQDCPHHNSPSGGQEVDYLLLERVRQRHDRLLRVVRPLSLRGDPPLRLLHPPGIPRHNRLGSKEPESKVGGERLGQGQSGLCGFQLGDGGEAAAAPAAPSFPPTPLPRRRRALVEGAPLPSAPWPRGIPAGPLAAPLAETSASAAAAGAPPLRPPPPVSLPPGMPGRAAIFRPSDEAESPPSVPGGASLPNLAAEARVVRFIIKIANRLGRAAAAPGQGKAVDVSPGPKIRRQIYERADVK